MCRCSWRSSVSRGRHGRVDRRADARGRRFSVAITVATRRAWPLAIAALDVVAALVFDLAEPTDRCLTWRSGTWGCCSPSVSPSSRPRRAAQLRAGAVRAADGVGRRAPRRRRARAAARGASRQRRHPETGPDTPAAGPRAPRGRVAGTALVVAIRRAAPAPPITALAAAGLALTLAPLTLRSPTRTRSASPRPSEQPRWRPRSPRTGSGSPAAVHATSDPPSTLVLVVATAELVGDRRADAARDPLERATRPSGSRSRRFRRRRCMAAYLPLTYVDQAVDRGNAATCRSATRRRSCSSAAAGSCGADATRRYR